MIIPIGYTLDHANGAVGLATRDDDGAHVLLNLANGNVWDEARVDATFGSALLDRAAERIEQNGFDVFNDHHPEAIGWMAMQPPPRMPPGGGGNTVPPPDVVPPTPAIPEPATIIQVVVAILLVGAMAVASARRASIFAAIRSLARAGRRRCKHLQHYSRPCPDHGADCPEVLFVRTGRGGWAMPVRDGGSSYLPIRYCPFCGAIAE